MIYTKKKKFVLDKWAVLVPKIAHILITLILKSQGMISFMINTGSLNNQNMTRILKKWRHDFSGKHLRDRYYMDIIWCLCGGQNSWFSEASFRICYVSLFECKGPWMLKNVINCYVWNLKKYHIQCCQIFIHTFVFNIFCF